jgi:cytochrome b561
MAWLTWGVGLSATGFGYALFWVSTAFISKIVVAYCIGTWFYARTSQPLKPIAALLLGILVYALLASIPIFGWVVAVVTTLLGLGALWMTVRDLRTPPPSAQPPVSVEVAGEPTSEPAA